jgi:hypothetical protein
MSNRVKLLLGAIAGMGCGALLGVVLGFWFLAFVVGSLTAPKGSTGLSAVDTVLLVTVSGGGIAGCLFGIAVAKDYTKGGD